MKQLCERYNRAVDNIKKLVRDLPACVAWEVAGERSASMRGVGGSW